MKKFNTNPIRAAAQRGVVLVIMLLAIVLIASLLYYVLNLGKHVNNRIVTQHSADATANAQGTWIARQFNTVAMNNITITRYLAAIPVLDSQPMVAQAQYDEYDVLLKGLERIIDPEKGINHVNSGNSLLDSVINTELSRIHSEMTTENDELKEVHNTFRNYDITQDTHYPGNMWTAIENLNEISIACMNSLPTLANVHASDVGRANLQADNSPGIFVTTIPWDVDINFRHSEHSDSQLQTSFDDFINPVLHGSLPDYDSHRITNRGPFDTVFGQRSLEFSMLHSPGQFQQAHAQMPQSLFALFDTQSGLTSQISKVLTPPSSMPVTLNEPEPQTTAWASLALPHAMVSATNTATLSSPFGGGYQSPPSDTSHPPLIEDSPYDRPPTGYHTYGILGRILNDLQHNPNRRPMPFNRHINLYRQNYAQMTKYVSRNELNYLWPQNGFKQHNRMVKPLWTADYPSTLNPDDQTIARTAYLRLQIKSRYRWGQGFMQAASDGSLSPTYNVQSNFGQNASNQVQMRESRQSPSIYMIMSRNWWLGDNHLNPMDLRAEPDEDDNDQDFDIPPFAEVREISDNKRMWLYLDNTLVRPVPEGDSQVGVPPYNPDDDNDNLADHVVYIYQVLIYLGINENPICASLDSQEFNPHDNSDLTNSQRRALRRENDNTFSSTSQLANHYPDLMDDEAYVRGIPNPFEGINHDTLPGPVTLDSSSFNRGDDGGECDAARESIRVYQSNKLTFLAYASRHNQAAFWPSRFDRTKPTNRTQGVAQVTVFNNHSFDLWTPMWQVQLQQATDFQNWVNRAEDDLAQGNLTQPNQAQLQQMIFHLQAVTPLAEARLWH
ncbi:MAG: hypothetical protein JKX85_11860 [Phycisphaeraceae bacterium]|nr:hypothetical protein [Phycisphaeraceae bacterium]